MVYPKGNCPENRGWPRRMSIESHRCGGDSYMTRRYFGEIEKLSLCERGYAAKSRRYLGRSVLTSAGFVRTDHPAALGSHVIRMSSCFSS